MSDGEGLPPDTAAAKQLSAALMRVTEHKRVERVAPTAYVQAVFAQAASQAVIRLLVRKNLISEAELQRALAEAYNDLYKQLAGSNTVLAPQAPVVRPGDLLDG